MTELVEVQIHYTYPLAGNVSWFYLDNGEEIIELGNGITGRSDHFKPTIRKVDTIPQQPKYASSLVYTQKTIPLTEQESSLVEGFFEAAENARAQTRPHVAAERSVLEQLPRTIEQLTSQETPAEVQQV